MKVRSARLCAIVVCGALTATCGSAPSTTPTPKAVSQPADARVLPEFSCKVEGCCAGHGEVARVQPDKLIICTDGEPSQICDCH